MVRGAWGTVAGVEELGFIELEGHAEHVGAFDRTPGGGSSMHSAPGGGLAVEGCTAARSLKAGVEQLLDVA